jgi:MFS family permease
VAAEVAMYLPVPIFGYLCDRYSPAPVSLLSAFLFGAGYLLAAFTYKSGPPSDAGGHGWSYAVMVVSFLFIGAGTACMYLAAVTTCAKNFGRSKYKGIMLAMPIAAFGLSGMWQSQVGRHLLYERLPDGRHGDVDVFKYFLFLAILLFVAGLGGTFILKVVDEEAVIDEAIEELERSGYLSESGFLRPASYGTFGDDGSEHGDDEEERDRVGEKDKKNWLLNQETRLFLKDRTMWWLAAGFFLVTGPGEAYINNVGSVCPLSNTHALTSTQVGTVLHTLTPPSYPPDAPPPAGLPSTHVTTIALTSTIARLLTGSLSDLLAPTSSSTHLQTLSLSRQSSRSSLSASRFTLSRVSILLPSALVLSLGYLFLATPFPLSHPSSFHLTTILIGFGYGASFSLAPLIISVVWGVENFGTNWGIVAMVPAVGAAVWGVVYSAGYEAATDPQYGDGRCYGWRCYGFWAIGCTVSVWIAMGLWMIAWRQWRRRGVVV